MRPAASLLAIVLCAFSATAALADDHDDDNRRAARGRHGDRNRPNNEAANQARQQVPGGRVLSVQPTEDGQRRVKVLRDGEVHVLTVPESEQNKH